MLETARRGRLAEYAYDYTKRMLFDGRLAPGAKLRVEDVVASLQTSRQPVMDAFKRLASEGYLEITPQVGCRVIVPNPAEIADFFLILGAVQGLAAEIAAERHTPDEIATLAAITDQIEALADKAMSIEIARTYHAFEYAFQERLRAMAHSHAVTPVAMRLLDRREFYTTCVADGETTYALQIRDAQPAHRAIVDAIAARDAGRARAQAEVLVRRLGRLTTGAPVQP